MRIPKLLHRAIKCNGRSLVERRRPCAPVGQEQAEADSLEDAGKSANGNGVERALLGENLGDDLMHVSDTTLTGNGMTWDQ